MAESDDTVDDVIDEINRRSWTKEYAEQRAKNWRFALTHKERFEVAQIVREELAKREKEDNQLQFEFNEYAYRRELWPLELGEQIESGIRNFVTDEADWGDPPADEALGRRWTHYCSRTRRKVAWDSSYIKRCPDCGMERPETRASTEDGRSK